MNLIPFILLILAPSQADIASPQSLKLVGTIPLTGKPGRFDHLALDTKNNRLFLANLSNDSLDVIILDSGKLIKRIPGQLKAQGVAYSPKNNRIYQGNGVEGVCNIFDGNTYEKLHSIALPGVDNVRYHPNTGLVYVAHSEKMLTAFDADSFEIHAKIRLPGPPEAFQIDSISNRLYINCVNPGTVCSIDLTTHKVVDNFPLSLADANYPMALDPKNNRIFVGCRNKPMVVILDTKTGKELTGVSIPGDIDDLFFDAKRGRLYASCGEGVLAVLEERNHQFSTIEKIPTAKLSRTCLFDPVGDRLFVVNPQSQSAPAELRVYQPNP